MFGKKTARVHEKVHDWLKQNSFSDYHQLMITQPACCHMTVLQTLAVGYQLTDTWQYVGYEELDVSELASFVTYEEEYPTYRSGAIRFFFKSEAGETFEAVIASAWADDDYIGMSSSLVVMVSLPKFAIDIWQAFEKRCTQLENAAIAFRNRVYVVGGAEVSFDTSTSWDDIYLPAELKTSIMQDVDAFFERGVAIYQRLKINPFRKLLFAGLPGTGKTMLCSALAKWAIDKGYFVAYVSGANQHGAQFWKIHRALRMASSAETRAIVIVEELDAYLDEESKAELLNVLDGSETPNNPYGTMLIATTNHPEVIDDRVMKRPGRLDRVFIIPELQDEDVVAHMLKMYLGDDWREEHMAVVPDLIKRPAAFIREVALYALTMAAYRHLETLSVDILKESLQMLVKQIEAKDDFLTSHKRRPMGLMETLRINGDK